MISLIWGKQQMNKWGKQTKTQTVSSPERVKGQGGQVCGDGRRTDLGC